MTKSSAKERDPVRIASPSGLSMQINANGSVRRIDHGSVMINAYLGNALEGGSANLYLRRRGAAITSTPLLGPRSTGAIELDDNALRVEGEWNTLRYRVSLVLAQSVPAWFWHVDIENAGRDVAEIDLIYAQDIALADYWLVRLNEYYVSQYVDHTPLSHAQAGVALAVRQNLAMSARHPWLLLGSLRQATSFCTDALQLHGLSTRNGNAPVALQADQLPGTRLQHEHSMAVLQDQPIQLAPNEHAALGFFAWFAPDHPLPSSDADLITCDRALALPEAAAQHARGNSDTARHGADPSQSATLFSDAPLLVTEPLDASSLREHFGDDWRCIEEKNGQLFSFFLPDGTHVVLPEKERTILRPHGQIMRTGERFEPDEASLTSTVWMNGVFHSMVTQGHVNINRFLSTTHSYLGLFRSHGQRLFVEHDGGWKLLAMPSAFEMQPQAARWLYRFGDRLLEVRAWAGLERHELWLSANFLAGRPCRLLVTHHVALNGDDGSEAGPARWSRDGRGIAIACTPDTDLARRFPDGAFRIDSTSDTIIERVGGDELLFADEQSRRQPYVVLITAASQSIGLRITGQLTQDKVGQSLMGGSASREFEVSASAVSESNTSPKADVNALYRTDTSVLTTRGVSEPAALNASRASNFWKEMIGPLEFEPLDDSVAGLNAALPWLAHDAWIHYLAPRGLEQYSGGGWGTRDVCQGPLELLLATGRVDAMRALLTCVFSNQNPDGDWPQWFMFFERERNIRAGDSHGDIVFWPLLGLAQYLLASGDGTVLNETLPFFHAQRESAERGTVLQHVNRALALIDRRVIAGTRLAAYAHGDWNDALQPADPVLATQLCSAWTVTLHFQTLSTLAEGLRVTGHEAVADSVAQRLAGIREDFQRLLVRDGVVAGLVRFGDEGEVTHWLHPSDTETGVHYSLLPMVHGILANLFDPKQAREHVEVIGRHLLAHDGARLFDRPLLYGGGIQRRFQRAETSTFFGREIGLMYMHAHLRYAEAMAHLGDGEAMYLALRQANPVGLKHTVRNARLRQANCYTSSSDAAFVDRYAATAEYNAVRDGTVDVEGGWRVYSSGAGIAIRLVRESMLGVRLRARTVCIDPVLPHSLDGLSVRAALFGHRVKLRYRVGLHGHGPRRIVCNGKPLEFEREVHPYRIGGALIATPALRERLGDGDNTLEIEVG